MRITLSWHDEEAILHIIVDDRGVPMQQNVRNIPCNATSSVRIEGSEALAVPVEWKFPSNLQLHDVEANGTSVHRFLKHVFGLLRVVGANGTNDACIWTGDIPQERHVS